MENLDDFTGDFERCLFVMRHGERVDQVYGNDWIDFCFDKTGTYFRQDLNLPRSLPQRANKRHHFKDAPLTMIGLYQATLTGEQLKEKGVSFEYVFSSPSLRCVQTATNVLKAMNMDQLVKINIEPGLFEWLGEYYRDGRPQFLEPKEIKNAGYNINLNYKSIMTVDEVLERFEESIEDWYERAHHISSTILDQTKKNVLILAHGGSLDACTRKLRGKAVQESDGADFVPYCGILTLGISKSGEMVVVKPPVKSLKHNANAAYDWTLLKNF